MNQLGFILMLIFLSLSIALYGFGILVVNHINLTVQLDHKIRLYYNWVLQYGSRDQIEVAKIAVQNRDLERLQALVGIESTIR